MTTVLQVEYVGDLAPYDLERADLAAVGAELRVIRSADPAAVVDAARDAEVIWLEWVPRFTADVLRQLPSCQLVLRWGVGYDQIDVAAATGLGIAVGNAPTYCTSDVAEHTMALILSATRQVAARTEQLRAGHWRDVAVSRRRLAGSVVGVVGLGRIGRAVAALANAFGATVLGTDIRPAQVPGVHFVPLAQLLSDSDIVTLHVPLGGDGGALIGPSELATMKRGSILVNTSRGRVVDQLAVREALLSGQLGSAALDVFEVEPLPVDDPIRTAPGIILTAHDASFSPQSVADLRREIVAATVSWVRTGWAASVVNPEVRGHTRWKSRHDLDGSETP